MCDTTFSSQFPATYTGIDIANAQRYASMRMLYEKVQQYNSANTTPSNQPPLEWINRYPDGKQTSYPCDMNNTGLKCYEGAVRIFNEDECNARSVYNPDATNPNDYFKYLQWLPPLKNTTDPYSYNFDLSKRSQGDCYYGNWMYRNGCENAFMDKPTKDQQFEVDKDNKTKMWELLHNKLHFDDTTGQCLMSKDYCHSTGYGKYTSPDGTEDDVYGGTCSLTGGQKALEYVAGSTATRLTNLLSYGLMCPGKVDSN